MMTKEMVNELKPIIKEVNNDTVRSKTLTEILKYKGQVFQEEEIMDLLKNSGYKSRKVLIKHILKDGLLGTVIINPDNIKEINNMFKNEPNAKIRADYYKSLFEGEYNLPVDVMKEIKQDPDTEVRISVLTVAFGLFFDAKSKIISLFKDDPNLQIQELLEIYEEPVLTLSSDKVLIKNKQKLIDNILQSFEPKEINNILKTAYKKGGESTKELIIKNISKIGVEMTLDTFKDIFLEIAGEADDFAFMFFNNLVKGYNKLSKEIGNQQSNELLEKTKLFDKAQNAKQYKHIFSVMTFEYFNSHKEVLNLVNTWLDSMDSEMISVVFPIAYKHMDQQLTKYIKPWINSKSEKLIGFALKILSKTKNIMERFYKNFEDDVIKIMEGNQYTDVLKKKAVLIIKKRIKIDIASGENIFDASTIVDLYERSDENGKIFLMDIYYDVMKINPAKFKEFEKRIVDALGSYTHSQQVA
jgi:hypothetical protein